MQDAIEVQLKKGVLELCVLALLAEQESYAYEIAARLAGLIGMSEGTIYPLMRRLQNERLVETRLEESSSGPSRKYYRLTGAGQAAFARQKAAWAAFQSAVQTVLGGTAPDQGNRQGDMGGAV